MAMNVNFRGGTEEFDLDEPAPKTKPKSDVEELKELLVAQQRSHAQQLADQNSHATRRFSELFEQQQLQTKSMLEHLKSSKPRPEYEDDTEYWRKSQAAETAQYVSPDDVAKIAKKAAKEVVHETVQTTAKEQQQRQAREVEIVSWFRENMPEMTPFEEQIGKMYQKARIQFPKASVDDQFAWAIETVKDVTANLPIANGRQQPRPNPVGGSGTGGSSSQYQPQQQTEGHREMIRDNDKAAMQDYYKEMKEYQSSLADAFDQW